MRELMIVKSKHKQMDDVAEVFHLQKELLRKDKGKGPQRGA